MFAANAPIVGSIIMNHINFDSLNDITFSTLFAIPDYQRDYSWGRAEVETLLDDIRELHNKNGVNGTQKHFCGSIVVIKFDPKVSKNTQGAFQTLKLKNFEKVNVIDGQQRLSTLSLLLIAIKNRLRGTGYSVTKFEDMIDTGMKDDNGDFVPVLSFADINTQNCYRSLLYGKNIDYFPSRSGAKNMRNAFGLCEKFVERICTATTDVESALDRLIEQVRYHLTFVGIYCEEEADAYQIFESLNATGLSLTPAEQVKNLMLMKSQDNNAHTLSQWENIVSTVKETRIVAFLSHYLFYKNNKRVLKKDVYEEFKGLFKQESVNMILNELSTCASIYGELRDPSATNQAATYLLDMQDLGVEQAYVPLLAAGKRFGVQTFEFKGVADAILVYIVRHLVCSQSSNRLDTVFSQACTVIKDCNKSAADVIRFFKEKRMDDEKFHEHFTGLTFDYTAKPQRIARTLLRRIEEYAHGANYPVQFNRDDITVEHIIPKHPEIDDLRAWIGSDVDADDFDSKRFTDQTIKSIGNLALLFQPENTSAGNENYASKIAVYTSPMKDKNGKNRGIPCDNFKLIEGLLAKNPTWFDGKSVQARSESLARLAEAAWA